MRTGLTISAVGHAALLLWSVLSFVTKPHNAESTEAMPIDLISAAEFSRMTAGIENAPKNDLSQPLVDKVAERKPADDPNAKLAMKEIKAATDAPPMPEPKPPAPAEKKPAEPKQDVIAEAIKKDEAKKPDPKKMDAKVPTPAKPEQQQPKFDPRKLAALLDKRTPQRLAATGDTLNETVSLGAPSSLAAQLSQTELGAMIERLQRLWNPPAAASNPEELNVLIRIKLNPDGRLAGPPMVLTSGNGKSASFAVARDAAARAVLRGQPFDMLRPEHYEEWKEVDINFDYTMWMRNR